MTKQLRLGRTLLTKQIRIPVLGEFKQLVGGSMMWVTFSTFAFAGAAAWDSEIVLALRRLCPWLTFYTACAAVFLLGLTLVWLEHKFTQPSVMVYWLKMFWGQRNPMRDYLEETLGDIQQRLGKLEELEKQLAEITETLREVD